MAANQAWGQILAVAPMVMPSLGIPQAKIDLILACLKDPEIMVGDQPNFAKLLELKSALEAIPVEQPSFRLICKVCGSAQKVNLGGHHG